MIKIYTVASCSSCKKAKEWLESVSCEEIESYLGANEEPF